jgi:enoyl-CoA hydratase
MADSRISLRIERGVAVIELDDGKVNAMQRRFLEELGEVLDRALVEKARAVVITGRPGCFSAGLDLKNLPTLDKQELRAVLALFGETMLRVFLFERPVVAAISGHAIAGGCVLAMAADRRLIAQGPFRVGLNEVPLAIELPAFVVELARNTLPTQKLELALFTGALSEGADVERDGWVEAIVPADELLPRAIELAHRLGGLPNKAYTRAKHLVRMPAVERGRITFEAELDGFMNAFGKRE